MIDGLFNHGYTNYSNDLRSKNGQKQHRKSNTNGTGQNGLKSHPSQSEYIYIYI